MSSQETRTRELRALTTAMAETKLATGYSHASSLEQLWLPLPTILRPFHGLKIPLAFGSPTSSLASF